MSKNEEREKVRCCVKNCQKEVDKEQAILIKDKYFCGICGVAFYRSNLNF